MNFERNTSNNESSTLHSASHINISGLTVQRKLSVGAVNDPLEHEADVMADKVMSIPESNFIQRKCAHCEEEEKAQRKPLASFIQKKEAGNDDVTSDTVSNQIHSTKGSGNVMPESTKSFMESRFGVDFSDVKIHLGNNASQLSNKLNAQAFTVGNDIYFNEGKYSPESNEGKRLLAHELTHTIQQGNLDAYPNTIQRDEKEAVGPMKFFEGIKLAKELSEHDVKVKPEKAEGIFYNEAAKKDKKEAPIQPKDYIFEFVLYNFLGTEEFFLKLRMSYEIDGYGLGSISFSIIDADSCWGCHADFDLTLVPVEEPVKLSGHNGSKFRLTVNYNAALFIGQEASSFIYEIYSSGDVRIVRGNQGHDMLQYNYEEGSAMEAYRQRQRIIRRLTGFH